MIKGKGCAFMIWQYVIICAVQDQMADMDRQPAKEADRTRQETTLWT